MSGFDQHYKFSTFADIKLIMLRFPLIIFLCISLNALSQRTYSVGRIKADVTIDGELKEDFWNSLEVADDFTIRYPNPGEKSSFNSKIRVAYDDDALYLAGQFYDRSPDSVSYTLSQRDDFGNGDFFEVTIDPFGNNVNAFGFGVTAAGVEWDAILYIDGEDVSWNAVWKSATQKTDFGWTMEMRIPFSAIRFPNKSVQEWNVNFIRSVRRNREESYWSPIDPSIYGNITQAGRLTGLTGIEAPIRLSLTPYITGYLENFKDEVSGESLWRERINGGMDLKYGLNDAFTLDMTLIPDFGQTVSDKRILNLGPFEVRYDENRPFFLEGTDLFSIGDVFYSRRIGAPPFKGRNAFQNLNDSIGEEVVSSPGTAPLINATKVSGRTKSGLGIGFFNAIEGRANAIIEDSVGNQREVRVHNLSNYNVFVLSQNLKNNSTISFVNTNVTREGNDRDANVTVGQAELYSKDRMYQLFNQFKLSSIFENGEETYGHHLVSQVRKVSGSWRFGLRYEELSDTYDPNDLGFLYNNNWRAYNADLSYIDFNPGKKFLRKWIDASIYYEELYRPNLFSYFNISGSFAGTLRNFLTLGANSNINPVGEVDHFESRQFGRPVKFGENITVGGFISSDYSKKFALDVRTSIKQFINSSQKGINLTVSPRVRFSDRIFGVWSTGLNYIVHDYGYVRKLDEKYADDLILGYRDRKIVENSLDLEFIFTKRMGINVLFRHYWQQVSYNYFKELLYNGDQIESNYNPLNSDGFSQHNTSYNAFTVDINYRWVFIPGSEFRIVYKNNIFDSQSILLPSYFDTFETIFSRSQVNTISAKLLVYIDAIYFRRKSKV